MDFSLSYTSSLEKLILLSCSSSFLFSTAFSIDSWYSLMFSFFLIKKTEKYHAKWYIPVSTFLRLSTEIKNCLCVRTGISRYAKLNNSITKVKQFFYKTHFSFFVVAFCNFLGVFRNALHKAHQSFSFLFIDSSETVYLIL